MSPIDPAAVEARIARLLVYPIKSCAGVDLPRAQLTETGLDYDRAWMVVDEEGEFVTQRELPRMALIQPRFRASDMVLRAPGMLALHLMLDQVEEPCKVRIWNDEVAAYDMGNLAAQWFSDFLLSGHPDGPRKLRLVRFDPEHQRLSSRKWTGDVAAPNQFSDGFPLLLTSLASHHLLNRRLESAGADAVAIERFRPNIVLDGLQAHDEDRMGDLVIQTGEGPVVLRPVKPCPRCPIPNIDPVDASVSPEVSDALQSYRQDPKQGGAVTFGMNAIVLQGDQCWVQVGQMATTDWRFD